MSADREGWCSTTPSGFRASGSHKRKVGQYRKGHCFLSGDAAHIHSPAGGQGMNTGMQDAYNPAWKVAMVHRGLAKPEILDSYSLEREAVGALVLKRASHLTHIATFRNPLLQFARNHIALPGCSGSPPSGRRSLRT